MSANLKYEEIEIDGIKIGTTQYAAMRGLELLGKLARTVGPAMGALTGMDPKADDLDKYAPMIAMALRDLQPTELSALVVDVLAGSTATINDNGTLKRIDLNSASKLDQVFSGKLLTMFKALLHSLKVNYSDFGFGSAAPNESAPETP